MDRQIEPEYRRYVAVLREDKSNYAITPTRRPRGKAIVEVRGDKGLLNCWVKNLAPPQKNISQSYVVWLVNEEEGKSIPVKTGIIEISKGGVGESSWRFEVDDVIRAGLDLDTFVNLEVRVNKTTRRTPGDRVLIGQLELEEVNVPEEPKMEKVSPFGANLSSHQWWKFYPGHLNEGMSNQSEPGSKQPERPPEAEQVPPGMVFGGVPDNNAYLSRECLGKPGELKTGPAFQGHQLVGLQCDEKGAVMFLVHGIPGRFCLRDQPYGGATGYAYWHPLPGQQYKAGEYGYWLIYLNPETGEVKFPNKATIPPDCDHCDKNDRD